MKTEYTVIESTSVRRNLAGFDMVCKGYSMHNTRAEANAEISWNWKKRYPDKEFEVLAF